MHHKNHRNEETPQVTTVVIKLSLILNYLYKYIYNRGEGNSLLLKEHLMAYYDEGK